VGWTQTDLDNLDEAIATGARTVSHGDKTVKYRSLDSMLTTRNLIVRYLATPKKPSTTYGQFSRGSS